MGVFSRWSNSWCCTYIYIKCISKHLSKVGPYPIVHENGKKMIHLRDTPNYNLMKVFFPNFMVKGVSVISWLLLHNIWSKNSKVFEQKGDLLNFKANIDPRPVLSRLKLSKARMSWVKLSWAELSWVELSWAQSSWVELSQAELSWVKLSW